MSMSPCACLLRSSSDPYVLNDLESKSFLFRFGGAIGKLSLRRRLRDMLLVWRERTRPASGAAMTMVPGVAKGWGSGESDRKRG